ncbi:MAG: hypothetical protein ACFE78_04605 [Candidatus Hodarchaeota archaeon]
MSKKTVLYSLTILFIIGITITNISVKAHSPTDMSLIYSSSSDELQVTITHNVGDPNTHYIQTITIRVNGSIDSIHPYTSQPTSSTFVRVYNVTANIGATIQVTAECNQGGEITRNITVTGQNGQTEEEPIRGYFGILLIIGISTFLITLLLYKRKRGELKICQ